MNFNKIKRIIKLQRKNIWGNIWGRPKTKDQRGIALVTIIIIAVVALAATGTSIVVYNVVVDETEDIDTAASQVEEQEIPSDALTIPPLTTSAPEEAPQPADPQPDPGGGGGNQLPVIPPDCSANGVRLNEAGNACETFTCDTEGQRIAGNACETFTCPEGEKIDEAGNDCEPFTCDTEGQRIAGNACETFTCDTEGQRFDSTGNACVTFTCSAVGERFDSTGNACETFTCPGGERFDSTGNACEEIPGSSRPDTSSTPPVAFQTHVALSDFHGCVLLADGSVKCWGQHTAGELGSVCSDCSNPKGTITPVAVPGLPSAKLLAVRNYQTCAILQDDVTLWCWGSLGSDFGFDLSAGSYPPTEVTTFSGRVRSLTLTTSNACALLVSGQIECIGPNISFGQGSAANNAGQLGPGYVQGATPSTPARVNYSFGSQVVDQFVHGSDFCVLTRQRKEVWCWGGNHGDTLGQLGHTMATRNIPTRVEGIPGRVSKIDQGDRFTCALLEDFRVYCWGSNNRGQSGPGVSNGSGGILESSPIPQEVGIGAAATTLAGLKGSDIAAGDFGACIVTNPDGDGQVNVADDTGDIRTVGGTPLGPLTADSNPRWKVYCWGYRSGQPEEGITHHSFPGDAAISTDRIYAGGGIWCHLLDNPQEVRCWGRNDHGQRGAGAITANPFDGFTFALPVAAIVGIP